MPSPLAPALKTRARSLAAALREYGVRIVVVEYDRYSGQDRNFLNKDNQRLEVPDAIAKSIEAFFYDLLENGWQDGDNWFGTFTWRLDQELLNHRHHACYTDYDTTDATYNLYESHNHAELSP